MGKPSSKTTPKTTNNKFWKFCNLADSQKAELFLYGDISETSWWGDEVTPKQFADDLAALGDVTEITVYINSGGGDVFAAQAIGNQLARNAATVTAHIDGLCASAATIVACHADKVVAAADSTYMVHPVSMGLCGYLTADEMRNYLKALDATRESIVSLYAKKTGHDADECAKWMDETNWWTADEAKENGFVDEVDDAEEDAVVENRNGILFVNSVGTHLPFNEAPEFVRNRAKAKPPAVRPENNHPAEPPEHNDHGEVKDMEIKTKDDLRKAYPDMVAQIENDAAVAERTRIQEIEAITIPGTEDQAEEAKFTKPVDSASYAKTVIANMKAKQQTQSNGTTWELISTYSPDIAEQKYQAHLREKGPGLKIGKDHELAAYIENTIIEKDCSPAAVYGYAMEEGKTFKTHISIPTVYSYIKKGVFLNLTQKALPRHGIKKNEYQKVKKKDPAKAPAGESIEKRPEEVKSREEFGHWEMDTVYSGKKKSTVALLVLTERKTRNENIILIPNRRAETTVRALDALERKLGAEKFGTIYKSITVDNGTEFAMADEIEKSCLIDGKRTKVYYCHPYSSWERGSNENVNGMIRRRHPKGTDFSKVTAEEIAATENWINNYPRKIHGYKSAAFMFRQCLRELGLTA